MRWSLLLIGRWSLYLLRVSILPPARCVADEHELRLNVFAPDGLGLGFTGDEPFCSSRDWDDTERCKLTMLNACSRLRRRQQNQRRAAQSRRPMTPPTTPPIRAALLDDLPLVLAGVVVSAVVEAARTLVVWSAVTRVVVGDVVEGVCWAFSELAAEDVVLVLPSTILVLLSLGALDIKVDVLDVVVEEETPDSSSGQIPVIQGSLEQHPS